MPTCPLVFAICTMICLSSLPAISCWTTSSSGCHNLHTIINTNKIATFSTSSHNIKSIKRVKKWIKPTTVLCSSTNSNSNSNNEEEVTLQFETFNEIKQISIEKGELLRTALMKRGISPHNGKSRLINCRGLGTCGTCAVEVKAIGDADVNFNSVVDGTSPTNSNENRDSTSAHGAIQPTDRTTKENFRLNFPPHGSNDQSDKLRLACQIQIYDDVHVTKKNGFWGQSSTEGDIAEDYDAQLYFGDMEYILDDKSSL